jgi:glutathione S-transferase
MEYLEERYPEPALLPADPAARSLARLWLERFDDLLGDDYYAARRGDEDGRERLQARLDELEEALAGMPFLSGAGYGLADIAYVPWILRAQSLLGVGLDVHPSLAGWTERMLERPAVAAEAAIVAAL